MGRAGQGLAQLRSHLYLEKPCALNHEMALGISVIASVVTVSHEVRIPSLRIAGLNLPIPEMRPQ